MCFNVDFHLDLGGETLGERTIFGNPGNDVIKGHEMGPFFLYDPTVVAGGDLDWLLENLYWIVPSGFALFIIMIISCCVCCCRRRGNCGAGKEKRMTGVVDGSGDENL